MYIIQLPSLQRLLRRSCDRSGESDVDVSVYWLLRCNVLFVKTQANRGTGAGLLLLNGESGATACGSGKAKSARGTQSTSET